MKKILASLALLILIVNLVLMVLGYLDALVFWGVLGVVALFAFKGLHRIKK
ncbi:hypothetical protein HOA59_00580 [archaeon]|jgi:hypothetical protein|nr:hypothetical protein [archaeon]MBT6823915.1 hypothetical protein [archaeon]MBT7106791.1 hypothetical protein [archaeon]MBT7297289.1 hypothetical protein [archaeon]